MGLCNERTGCALHTRPYGIYLTDDDDVDYDRVIISKRLRYIRPDRTLVRRRGNINCEQWLRWIAQCLIIARRDPLLEGGMAGSSDTAFSPRGHNSVLQN